MRWLVRSAVPMLSIATLAALAVVLVASDEASATHFQGGSLHVDVDVVAAATAVVEAKGEIVHGIAFHMGAAEGACVTGGTIDWGDGSVETPGLLVEEVDPAQGVVVARFMSASCDQPLLHVYLSLGVHQIVYNECCRGGDVVNKADHHVRLQATVDLSVVNVAPDASAWIRDTGAEFSCHQWSFCTTEIPVAEGPIQYVRNATACEASPTCQYTEPPGKVLLRSTAGAVTVSWSVHGPQPGLYSLQFFVGDASAEVPIDIQIRVLPNERPVADFLVPGRVVQGEEAVFADRSFDPDGQVVAWHWQIVTPDLLLTESSESTLQHTFQEPGWHMVRLTVIDEDGGRSTATNTSVLVHTAAPQADFTYHASGATVQFHDNSTSAGGPIVSWDWQFGDGSHNATVQHPVHTYAESGVYNVTLLVTDQNGTAGFVTRPVKVEVPAPNESPRPDFAFHVSGRNVSFMDRSTDPDGTIVRWYWVFDDGNFSSLQSPDHTYEPGTYRVSLIVWDDDGAVASTNKTVVVADPDLQADFVFEATNGTVRFFDRSSSPSSPVVAWSWQFGDGSPNATVQDPVHTYAESGTYNVTLLVWTQSGNAAWVTKAVTLQFETPPVASFHVEGQGTTLQFFDGSHDPDGAIVAWSWDFGDGSSSTLQDPSHKYAPGTYTVTLEVVDDSGLSTSVQQTVNVPCRNTCGA